MLLLRTILLTSANINDGTDVQGWDFPSCASDIDQENQEAKVVLSGPETEAPGTAQTLSISPSTTQEESNRLGE